MHTLFLSHTHSHGRSQSVTQNSEREQAYQAIQSNSSTRCLALTFVWYTAIEQITNIRNIVWKLVAINVLSII